MIWEKKTGSIYFKDFIVGPAPNDDVLAFAYLRMKHAGILSHVYYEGVPDLRWFLDQMNLPNICVGCWREQNGVASFVGMSFVNKKEIMGRYSKAEIGFAFMPDATTIHEKVALAKAMTEQVFDEFGFDAIFGTTPAENRAAVAFSRRVGYTVHGPIKDFCTWNGELCPVYISQVSKSDWREKYPNIS